MAQHCIKGKRIRRVCIPKEYDIDKIQIGIPVICDEAKTVGLIKNGDEYYGAAEPPVRCGESHLSGLTEPLRSL